MKMQKFIFWGLAILGLLWNMATGFNFVMQTDPEFVVTMPEPFRSVVLTRPLWATAAFGLAAFAGFAASVMMLLQRSEASLLFLVTAVASMVVALPILTLPGGMAAAFTTVFSAMIAASLGAFCRRVLG